ncbi:hypothetical protein G8B50_13575 [Enterococcus durans]|uniref:hypothetical protein n=1 Tax=Enterococcus durans TaxID=53345 RepID=UPI0018842C59|nr:hypothetical protein [Enterococcus durans]MBE9888671.1 hypothetical protein [Enterococcus durans]
MKLYYVEKANCWVVEGCLSKYVTDIISTQFSELGLKVIFCGEFVSVKEAVLPMTAKSRRSRGSSSLSGLRRKSNAHAHRRKDI